MVVDRSPNVFSQGYEEELAVVLHNQTLHCHQKAIVTQTKYVTGSFCYLRQIKVFSKAKVPLKFFSRLK